MIIRKIDFSDFDTDDAKLILSATEGEDFRAYINE
jgi:hypothetical protein